MTEFYTGRAISWKGALDQADAVVIGRVVTTGKRDLGSLGQDYYDRATLRVERWLRTGLPESDRPNQLNFSYTVQRLPEKSAERAPEAGERLLFLCRMQSDGALSAIKILPVSGEETQLVEQHLLKQ